MNRANVLRTVVIATPLIAALLYIAFNWYRLEPETIWVNAGEAARKNPYLAYTRLLDRMTGGEAQSITGPAKLAELPKDATLVIAARRLVYMTPQRLRRLNAWVGAGGHLVVEAEPYSNDDPLLASLGIERVAPPTPSPGKPAPDAPAEPSYAYSTFEWPGAAKPLRVRFPVNRIVLRDLYKRPPLATITMGERTIGLAFSLGAGRVTALPSFAFLRNGNIGTLDHAEFGARIAGADRPGAPIVLFLRMESPPFLEWLWREAWAVALAAALLVALWLARIIPRFGPLTPDPPPVRRSLLEHIVASGRFLWSRGQRAYLLEAVRERVLRAAGRRGIRLDPASPHQAVEALAQLTALPTGAVGAALVGPADDAHAFVAATAALHRIESRLAQRRNVNPQPGNPQAKESKP